MGSRWLAAADLWITINNMYWALAVIFLVLWVIGLFTVSIGWYVHILLVLAVLAVIAQFAKGRGTRQHQ